MHREASLRRTLPALVIVLTATLVGQPNAKRPLTHRDYDFWKTITSQKLSDDGKWLAYALTPQQGDGEVVLKNLTTGVERRESIGSRPAAPPSGGSEPAEPGVEPTPGPGAPGGGARSIPLSFTGGRYLVFTTFPSIADTEKARKAKKKPEEMPKGGLVLLPLDGTDPIRIARVRSFQVAESNGQWLAYLKESDGNPAAPEEKTDAAGEDQRAGARQAAAGAQRREFGADLVLRNLNDQSERTFADALEYSLTRDANRLVYTVSSRKEETNGVYVAPTNTAQAKAVLTGKGRYQRLTWDDKQAQLAFLSTRDDAASRQAKYKLYMWRGEETAAAVVASDTPGIPKAWTVSERGLVNFSKDNDRLFFATTPSRAEPSAAPADPTDEKVLADLWHWKDDHIQPMQKVRAEQERNRSYRAVYHIKDKRTVQLADRTMSDITFNEDGKVGIGTDDREYRQMAEYDERYSDYYLVDVATGARTLLLRKNRGNLTTSPDGRYAVTFNGRDWQCLNTATGKLTNLTQSLGVAFYNEEHDMPGTRTSNGVAGWTKDSKYVLLNDRYDIWQLSPDGVLARNITDGVGRKENIQFRHVRMDEERAPGAPDRGGAIDQSKPLLLRAESLETRDSGFWEDSLDKDAPPRKLIMAAKSFSTPAKAKNADVLLLSATRFDEFGDLLVTDSRFSNPRKVTNANPQQEQFIWGKGELITFRNMDGTPLKAALYKPENFDPARKYPLIVYIYERLSQGVHTFRAPAPGGSINPTFYASNGYLVLTPDIAYSIGHPGPSALKCVLPAIQAVVDKGYVDENAIGIQGHSWGGYQIAYMVTQTNRFKAAAAGAPVANMTSAYDGIRWGTGLPRQFQYERTQSRIGGSLWQQPMRFIENSPLFHAENVKTPLLMLHNDGDDAVPWYQGIELFLAMRRLGKEAYLFNYNGEPHGIRKRINQRDYTMRMQQFFDHHLKGAPKPDWMERGIPYLDREQEKEQWKKVEALPSGGAQ